LVVQNTYLLEHDSGESLLHLERSDTEGELGADVERHVVKHGCQDFHVLQVTHEVMLVHLRHMHKDVLYHTQGETLKIIRL